MFSFIVLVFSWTTDLGYGYFCSATKDRLKEETIADGNHPDHIWYTLECCKNKWAYSHGFLVNKDHYGWLIDIYVLLIPSTVLPLRYVRPHRGDTRLVWVVVWCVVVCCVGWHLGIIALEDHDIWAFCVSVFPQFLLSKNETQRRWTVLACQVYLSETLLVASGRLYTRLYSLYNESWSGQSLWEIEWDLCHCNPFSTQPFLHALLVEEAEESKWVYFDWLTIFMTIVGGWICDCSDPLVVRALPGETSTSVVPVLTGQGLQ